MVLRPADLPESDLSESRHPAILLVDDLPANLLAMAAALEGLDAEIVQAASGEEALRLLLKREFAVVFLDVTMPRMDGLETAELIRGQRRTRGTPIVFLTALSFAAEHVTRGYAVGAVDYLFRPVPAEVIRQKAAVFVALARESEARYRRVVDGIPAVLYESALDAQGSPLFVSPQVEGGLGWSAQDWIADPGVWMRSLHPDDAERVAAEYAHSVATGEPFESVYRTCARDGRVVWLHDRGRVLLAERGRSARVQGVRLDITAQRLAEAAAREYQQLLDDTLRSLPVPVFVLDAHGGVCAVNREAENIFGWPESEVIGRSPRFLSSEGKQLFDVLLARSTAGEQVGGVEVEGRTRDGVAIPLLLYLAPVRGPRHPLCNALLSVVDIRAQQAAADALRRAHAASKAVGRELAAFSYSVAHDLRAPLRAVSSYGAILQREFGGTLDPQVLAYVDKMVRSALRMGRLVDDLLSLSRCGQTELHRERVSLGSVASAILEELAAEAPTRAVTVQVADGLDALADPGLVRALLTNLLRNAWRFTSTHPTARIEVGKDPATGAFFVRDDGVGFDVAYAETLFQPFQRGHDAHQGFEGTGIGLAIVARIVARHDGRVWAEGEVAKGATFFFTLAPEDG